MSPVSRGRDGRRRQKRARRSATPLRLIAATSCDCEACASLESSGFDDPDDPAPAAAPLAPIYQIMVMLRFAQPSIWRRLEVAADTPLRDLHTILQESFNWRDTHSHVFDTYRGRYGAPGGHHGGRAESAAVLRQIAAGAGATFTYDYGDDWRLDLRVDQVIRRDQTIAYPRCTGGERAAPPQDCGGIHGYQELIDEINQRGATHDARLLQWREYGNGVALEPEDFTVEHVNDGLAQRFHR